MNKTRAEIAVRESLRKCTSCGLCNTSCPTFVLTRDERDSPRGRIIMIRSLMESDRRATISQNQHLDRCIGCMSCISHCPSDVDYAQLLNYARLHLQRSQLRSPKQRMVRRFLLKTLPEPGRLRSILRYARFARPVRRMLERMGLREYSTMLELAPAGLLPSADYAGPGRAATKKERKARVILLAGCTQQVMRPEINDATIRLLARRGVDVEIAPNAGCCGGFARAMGKSKAAAVFARTNIDAWMKLIEDGPVDAIIYNAAACGPALKDYPALVRHLPDYEQKATRIAGLACNITEFLDRHDLGPPKRWSRLCIAYHASCSLHHALKVGKRPHALLSQAGFAAVDLAEPHLCCGAAGGYNMLQPEMAGKMRAARLATIDQVRPDLVASSDIGCILHLGAESQVPVVHVVELLDWAYGGPVPRGLEHLAQLVKDVPMAERPAPGPVRSSVEGSDSRKAGEKGKVRDKIKDIVVKSSKKVETSIDA